MAKAVKDDLKVDEKSLLTRVYQDYNFAKARRDQFTSDWEKWRDQYNCEWNELSKTEDDEELKQWIYVPKTLTTIHRIECACAINFFGEGKLFKFTAPAGNEDPNLAYALGILDSVVHAKVDIELRPRRAALDACHTGLIEGQGVLKGGWRRDFIVQRDGRLRTVNRPSVQFIPNEHVLWDPYAITPGDILFFIHEVWLAEEELQQRAAAGIYENVDQLVGDADEVGLDEWRQDITGPSNQMRRLHKVLEFWGPQQLIEEDSLLKMHKRGRHKNAQDIVATIYRNKVVLRVERNPYAELLDDPQPYEKLPFWIVTPLPKTNSTYGYSMAEWLRSHQRETNLTRNQRRLAVQMEMTGKVVYDETRMTNLKALLSSRYGGAVGVAGPTTGAVDWWTPKTSTQNMVQEEAMMDNEMQDLSGVTGLRLGTPAPAETRTATATNAVMAEGNVKMDTILQNIIHSGLIPMGQFFAQAALEYVSPEEVQAIIQSETPPPFLKDIIKHDYCVEVEAGVSATSKALELQKIDRAIMTQSLVANTSPQTAIPALLELSEQQMRLLGLGKVNRFRRNVAAGIGQGQEPAGAGQEAMPGPEGPQSMARQGREPMPEEMMRS